MSALEQTDSPAPTAATTTIASPTTRLSLGRTLLFALSSLPIASIGLPLAVYLPRYFVSHVGIPFAIVGLTITTVRMIDLFFDPVLGLVMDRTRTPIGRYRPYMLLGAPVLMTATYMLFFAPVGADRNYLLCWLLVCSAGVSLSTLSQASWGAALATNYGDRSRVYGWVAAMGVLGTILVLALPIVLAHGGKATQKQDVETMGWFVLGVTPIAIAIVALGAPERVAPRSAGEKFRLGDYAQMIARPDMLRIIFADFVIAFGPGTTAALYLIFFQQARGYTPAQTNILLLFYIAAALFGSPFWGWLGARLQKHRTILLSSVVYSICQSILMIIPHATMSLAIPAMAAVGFAGAAFTQLLRAMVADVADEVRLEQNRERAGLLYSMVTTTTKVAGALTVGIPFMILDRIGFKASEGAVNSAGNIRILEFLYVGAPITFALVGASAFLGYKLDAKRHGDVRAKLEARDAQAHGRAG